MTTKVVEDKPADTSCDKEACEYKAVAAVWTNQHQQHGTVRTTVQWDLTDQGKVPTKADKLCNLHTKQLLANLGNALMSQDL